MELLSLEHKVSDVGRPIVCLRVMNALGQLVYQERLVGKGIVELALPKPATGLHIVGLYFDGGLVATEKLQVVR